MRPALLLSAFVVACNTTPASTATDTDGATGSSSGTTQGSSPVTDGSATMASTDTPTGSGGVSASGTTSTATSTSTSATDTGGSESTSPVQTDTGTAETGSGTTGLDTTDGPGTSTSDGTSTSTSTSSSGGDTSTGGMVEMCPCPDLEVGLDDGIFVLSSTAQLYKFYPMNNTLELLGSIGCDLPPSTFSMAVDRLGFAWVQYLDGQLRKVDVTNVAKCSNPGFQANQQGVTNFGMAFVSNSAFDACDQIFGDQYTGIGEAPNAADFFRIDPMTLQIVKLGKSDFGTAEVTGTGDGRVFLFAAKNPDTQLVEVDRNTGDTLSSIPLPGVKLGGGWAFAFFAGDFYFFTDGASDGKSEVTHIDYDDSDNNGKQDIKVVVNNAVVNGVNVKVVGAGVSTCAPTVPQ